MKIKIVALAFASALALAALVTAFAASSSDVGKNWRVYNGEPAASSFWDINPVKTTADGVQFPVQQFESPSTGSFAIYLLNNYNVDMTGKTISATDMNWTGGTYETRSTVFPGAYVRLEFQDTTSGTYSSNDYWWYKGSLDLNAVQSGNLTASLADRANWTNVCGQIATDVIAQPGPNCVGGTDPAVSPYDGFTNAVKNVKLVGLSFGSSGSYASGVALDGGTGTFTLSTFTIN
jgi:hypothetical protein